MDIFFLKIVPIIIVINSAMIDEVDVIAVVRSSGGGFKTGSGQIHDLLIHKTGRIHRLIEFRSAVETEGSARVVWGFLMIRWKRRSLECCARKGERFFIVIFFFFQNG